MRFNSRTIKGEPRYRMRLVCRLVDLIALVQRGPIPSVPVLAERFGVCGRTIRRDLSAIESVIPVRRVA